MAAAADKKRKYIPKELQDYKRKVKALSFREKVKAYFDCKPSKDVLAAQKRNLILTIFTKKETEIFARDYYPIFTAIDHYADKMRTAKMNIDYDAYYLDSLLRNIDYSRYVADFLNRLLPRLQSAHDTTKDTTTQCLIDNIQRKARQYNNSTILYPQIIYNQEKGLYEVNQTEVEGYIQGVTEQLINLLSSLKSYLDAQKEFLEWVGTPDLLPVEFKEMEEQLKCRFQNYLSKKTKTREQNPDAEEFPLFCTEPVIADRYLSLDYETLPHSLDIFGDNNLWVNTYRQLFNL